MVSPDYRCSMADSEWSQDDVEPRYVTTTNPGRSMYDVPPDAASRVMLRAVEEESVNVEVASKSAKKKDEAMSGFPRRERGPTRCWVKASLVLLILLVLALAGVLVYTICRKPSTTSPPPSGGQMRNGEVQTREIAAIKRILSELLLRTSNSSTTKSVTKSGCQGDDIRIGMTCYGVHVESDVIQLEAVERCWRRGGGLASVKDEGIQRRITSHLHSDQPFWIDGQAISGGFTFSDKENITDTKWRKMTGDGKCLAIVINKGINDVIIWKREPCFTQLGGYVCEYGVN
ncbi:uncharacterized protein LOC143460169 [Clavelina lepadiformis]|uniref:uncharacterized protein LOC143460169 n=1 Tax=Clavelina lepadiformis TaxID=159417 RepID=UPI0040419E11